MTNIYGNQNCNDGYDIYMLAGTTKDLCFHLRLTGDRPIMATGVTSELSISHYSDITMPPLIIEAGTINANASNEIENIIFHLPPSDTKNLHMGKYEYQVLIKDKGMDIDAPHHGFIFMSENNNKAFIGG